MGIDLSRFKVVHGEKVCMPFLPMPRSRDHTADCRTRAARSNPEEVRPARNMSEQGNGTPLEIGLSVDRATAEDALRILNWYFDSVTVLCKLHF